MQFNKQQQRHSMTIGIVTFFATLFTIFVEPFLVSSLYIAWVVSVWLELQQSTISRCHNPHTKVFRTNLSVISVVSMVSIGIMGFFGVASIELASGIILIATIISSIILYNRIR